MVREGVRSAVVERYFGVKNAGPVLDGPTYADLVKPSAAVTPFTYHSVAPGLFDSIRIASMQSDDALCRRYPKSMRADK